MDENQRFRRALKNPFVTIGLCLLAGFAVYTNIVDTASDAPGIISVGLNRLLSAPTLSPLTSAGRPHDDEAGQWIEYSSRDPFAPMMVASQAPSSPPSMGGDQTGRHPQMKHALTLKAIAVEGEQRSAVINRTVVYEGETIKGYQVLSIQAKGVWLKHQGKTQWLTFSEKATS
ncbi:MAG: hypothetical protein NPIRA03_04270 [Nitrospirales bacterium]|nr:MAG: hypothetical protein NPIRA03_04270 [Nitrospirales bacterium]